MKQEIISFSQLVVANTSMTLKERIKGDGAVTEVRVRFFAGQQQGLQVHPYVLHKNRVVEDVFTYSSGTDNFLSGDDDYLIFPVKVNIELDDEIAVELKNIDTTYSYTAKVFVTVRYDFEGGL